MTAYRALAEDDQAAREDVRAFDGDRDGHLLIRAREEIRWAHADAFAAEDVHAVVDHFAVALGDVVLRDRRDHRRLLAEIDGLRGQAARGVHHVQIAAHATERFLHAFEPADGCAELPPHGRVSADPAHRDLRHAHIRRRQRDCAARREAFHQHAPAVADLSASADHPVERDEHVVAPVRAVLEHGVQRPVAAPDVHARMARRNQRARDAGFVFAAEQMVGIDRAKREAEHRRDGAERDVALAPRHAKAERLASFERAVADNADVGDRRCVGARVRARQCEAGDIVAARETRQIVILLRIGAVVQQKLGGAERVRHHHRYGGRRAARGKLHDDLRMRVRGVAFAAVLHRDDHPEEALVLDELPGLRRQVLPDGRRFPVVREIAELLAFVVEKRLLLCCQLCRAVAEQRVPVRTPREERGVPPDGARFNRIALGLRHVGQDPAEDTEHAPAHPRAAQRPDRQHERGDDQHDREAGGRQRARCARQARGRDPHDQQREPPRCARPHVDEHPGSDDQRNDEPRHDDPPCSTIRRRLRARPRCAGGSRVVCVVLALFPSCAMRGECVRRYLRLSVAAGVPARFLASSRALDG
jgi:hypothetical protein